MTQEDRDSFIILKNDVEHIKSDIKETKRVVNDFNDKMTLISSKLFNDGSTGEEGFIAVAFSNRARLTKLENIKVALIAVILALGSAFGWIANNVLGK